MLGIPMPDEKTLRERLKQAIDNSKQKRYHGNEEHMNELPSLEQQAKTLLEEKVKPFEFYDEVKKEFLTAEDPKWKKAVFEKFDWIKNIHNNSASGDELTPAQFAEMNDSEKIDLKDLNNNNLKNKNDKLRNYITMRNNGDFINTVEKTTIVNDYPENYTWRDLFMKLCFE